MPRYAALALAGLSLMAALPVAAATSSAAAADAPVSPRARPLDARRYLPTAERLERGRYLSEHLLQCFVCHSERDWSQPGAPPVAGRKGAGLVFSEKPGRRLVAPNLTPDPETGTGRWSDDMLARAIREGIGHDGRALHPQMWYGSFSELADEDLAAVVVYLRALPAVRNPLPATELPAEERAEIAASPHPITGPVPGPAPGDRLARGRYLVALADCTGCHTSWHSQRNPGLLAGGNLIQRDGREVFSTNVTPDPSGAGYSADGFVAVIRSGKGGTLDPIMPWHFFAGLSDEDLQAMHAAFAEVQPVRHFIGKHGAPQHCAVCGQEHPLGAQNHLEMPPRVQLSAAQLQSLVGRYRNERYDWTVTLSEVAGVLHAQDQSGASIELYPQSAERLLAPGWPAPFDVRRDATGAVLELVARELPQVVLRRLP